MQALWMSLKENANCGSTRLNDVVLRKEKCREKRTSHHSKENSDGNGKLIHQMQNSFREVIIRQSLLRTRYSELNAGDPARNITEMIFHIASANPSRIIKRVLRVKSSMETTDRIERYREKVTENAYKQQKRHPRSTVDGNELFPIRWHDNVLLC